ncbi:MAG: hypothetical protein ACR2MN_08940 [Acidimicrobiales bacterium]
MAATDGGGGVKATYGPMVALAGNLSGNAGVLAQLAGESLGICGHPGLDGALSAVEPQFHAAVTNLAGGTSSAGTAVNAVAGNFQQADGS